MQSMSGTLVPCRVLEEVFLVVFLGIVPRARRGDLCDDFLVPDVEVLHLHLGRHALCDLLLFGGVEEDGGAVFCEV